MQIQEKPTSGKLIREVLFKESMLPSLFSSIIWSKTTYPKKKKKKIQNRVNIIVHLVEKFNFFIIKTLKFSNPVEKNSIPAVAAAVPFWP